MSLKTTAGRVSDATPVVLALVAGAVVAPGPQIVPLDSLEVLLRRDEELIGVLARRRELLPGRYTFGLTGRGPSGQRLPRGTYSIRVVARPGRGLRPQSEALTYVVR